jgi:cysteine desulfurase/selenocysteine lyase
MSRLDVASIKADFPILSRHVRDDRPLVYLDSGATSQKPRSVLDAERSYYEHHNAAAHRGAHQLAEEATIAFEDSRRTIAAFIGAEAEDVVFTKNATESINLLAHAFSSATAKAVHGKWQGDPRFVIGPGVNLVVTEMEHHANLLPWQELADKTGAELRWIGLTEDGRLEYSDLDRVIDANTRVVSFVHQSNILGTINDVTRLTAAARAVGAFVFLDACQSVPHMPIDVNTLGVDAIVWSGHKMLGPTGIGCLWGTSELLDAMPPFLTGGSMIETVRMEGSTFAKAPQKFEAGVPNIAQAVGLAAAVKYLEKIGMHRIAEHEHFLAEAALSALQQIEGVRIIGPANAMSRGSAVAFTVDDIHPHDVGQVLDAHGVAVRVGHHCAWPTCRRYGVPATTRATFYLYNDLNDVASLVAAVRAAQQFFKV